MKKVIRTTKFTILSILCLWTCFSGVASAGTIVTLTIPTPQDDAEELGFGPANWDNSGTTIDVDRMASTSTRVSGGFRFTGVTVPKGATINSATFKAFIATPFNADLYCTFWGDAVDNSVDFATKPYISNTGQRPHTTASLHIGADGFPAGYNNFTVTSIVQEIVNRAGWVSGNAMTMLMIADTGTAKYCTFYAWDWGIDEPQLVIDYQSPVLPIQLSSFTAQFLPGTQRVVLRWTTLSETNNYGFEVQRRREGEPEFATLPQSFIPGHGTTLEEHHYTYTDSIGQQGVWHYRLRQIDLDGTQHYTESARVEVTTDVAGHSTPAEFCLLQNYPNPFNPSTVIGFSLPKASYVSLVVYDLLGREVETLVHGELPAGNHSSVWMPKDLAGGVYIYCLRAQGVVRLRKLMLLR